MDALYVRMLPHDDWCEESLKDEESGRTLGVLIVHVVRYSGFSDKAEFLDTVMPGNFVNTYL